ncbi:MAG TPA: exosortase/archaeosortase family protein [Acidimicrobiales bacterium]|nr:exosortase/archaeosortase family protein [Acidimicrobiales bacterium]
MRARRRAAFGRVAAVVAGTVGGFAFVQLFVRRAETYAATAAVHALGITRAHVVPPTSIQVFPHDTAPFRAIITPSCSSAASIVALACLATLAPRHAGGRRFTSLLLAVSVVVVGNIVRIASSIGIGVVAGRASLVLFHDWVGSAFTFAYTLGGFVLMLFFQLPSRRPEVDVARS